MDTPSSLPPSSSLPCSSTSSSSSSSSRWTGRHRPSYHWHIANGVLRHFRSDVIYFRICLCLITILNNFGIHSAKWSFLELRSQKREGSHQRMPAFSHWTGHWTQSGRLRDTETASSKSTAYPDTGRRAHSYIHVLITKTIQTHRNLFYNKESWSTIMTRRKLVQQERNDQDVKILFKTSTP